MTPDQAKLLIALTLFGTWVALIVAKVPGTDDLIGTIKVALTGLSAHWLTAYTPPLTLQVPSGQASLVVGK